MSEELTEKQRYQREYYAKNKEKICANKRNEYTSKKPERRQKVRKKKTPKPVGAVIPTPPCKATSPVKKVNKMPSKARHRIEDVRLARELGISVDELN